MRFHAQRRPLGGTGGPLHGCRRSRGPRSWSQETRRARWRGFVRGVDMGGPGPTGRPYPTALECRAVDAPTGRGPGVGQSHSRGLARAGPVGQGQGQRHTEDPACRGRPFGHCSRTHHPRGPRAGARARRPGSWRRVAYRVTRAVGVTWAGIVACGGAAHSVTPAARRRNGECNGNVTR